MDTDNIGKRLREFGLLKYSSIKDFAIHLNMKQPSLHRYLNNTSLPGALILIKLFKLGADINYILTGETRQHNINKKSIINKDKNIGDRIREFGLSIFNTLSDFAKHLEMNPQSLQTYLNNTSLPGALILIKLFKLGADINYILTGETRNINNMGADDSGGKENKEVKKGGGEAKAKKIKKLNKKIEKLEKEIVELKANNKLLKELLQEEFRKSKSRKEIQGKVSMPKRVPVLKD